MRKGDSEKKVSCSFEYFDSRWLNWQLENMQAIPHRRVTHLTKIKIEEWNKQINKQINKSMNKSNHRRIKNK